MIDRRYTHQTISGYWFDESWGDEWFCKFDVEILRFKKGIFVIGEFLGLKQMTVTLGELIKRHGEVVNKNWT